MKPTAPKLSAVAFALWAASQLANAQITTTVGSASTAQALSINATGPLGAIVVTAPTGFEISTNASTGFAPSITLGELGGSIQSVYRGSFSTHTGNVWNNGSGSEFPNLDAFAAITSNGSVVTWGYDNNGGSMEVITKVWDGPNRFSPTPIRNVAENLTSNVTAIYSNETAFAALKTNGSLIAWGNVDSGGNSTVVLSNTINGTVTTSEPASVAGSLSSNIESVFSNKLAFAALKNNGSVVTWGDILHGGNSTVTRANYTYTNNATNIVTNELSSVSESLDSNVVNIFSSERAFAALKQDGSVVTWGDSQYGGNLTRYEQVWDEQELHGFSSEINVASQLSSGVINIFPSDQSFAALKNDGSVVIWGQNYVRGSAENLAANLSANITAVYYNSQAFAAVRKNGSV